MKKLFSHNLSAFYDLRIVQRDTAHFRHLKFPWTHVKSITLVETPAKTRVLVLAWPDDVNWKPGFFVFALFRFHFFLRSPLLNQVNESKVGSAVLTPPSVWEGFGKICRGQSIGSRRGRLPEVLDREPTGLEVVVAKSEAPQVMVRNWWQSLAKPRWRVFFVALLLSVAI